MLFLDMDDTSSSFEIPLNVIDKLLHAYIGKWRAGYPHVLKAIQSVSSCTGMISSVTVSPLNLIKSPREIFACYY